ncbi:MAG TPA: hypothetical protein VIG73_15425 [Cerasibacillus sp.]|uniref:hypothetical protein n=1 Tax=Cerasibacillus sp. TaxID=2498711 RepID=UPI002F41AC67
MRILKKSGIFLLFLLLLISIYKDITIDKQLDSPLVKQDQMIRFHVIKRQIETGETVLSIIEEIHGGNRPHTLNIKQILADFKMINPNSNPYQLKDGHFYFFPKYDFKGKPH